MNFTVTEVDAVFSAAMELPSAEQRAEYVQLICGDDAELRKRVDELLAAHFAAGEFLEQPAATILHRNNDDVQAGPGTVIGPYKLLQQIGEGGMGVVFMAEQTEPIQRTVALKIIKAGMDTRQVIARFEAERQALAMMDHPNIAKVLDAGTTDTGRPYFVMELVKGVPITKYCDDHKLTVRQRLELVRPVCEAVQHAHQKGIIHRDLKPSNVMVAEYDNRAVPKVIDFGVAKATAQKLTERTMFTEFGQVIGTIEYMSPEQAKFNQLDVDTRSDIYSLGVLLYELLTGSTPFERERLREVAFDEVMRIIREEEPPRPSTRLSTSETLPSIAANRHTEPNKLSRNVSGELDWIVMKCLEKDRNRRYETAGGLLRDVERYLNDEPVQACPPSAAYRFRKFARRNKAAIAAAAVGFTMLMMLVTGLAISNRLIAAERNEKANALTLAEAQRQRAENNLIKARTAIRDILINAPAGRGDWSHIHPTLRAKLTERAASFYQSLIHDETSDPALQLETGVGYRSLALLNHSLNNHQQAETFARQSINILERIPDKTRSRHPLAYSYYVLGAVLKNAKHSEQAEAAFQQAASLYEDLISEQPDHAASFNELPLCYKSLALLQSGRGALKEAAATSQRLIDLISKIPTESPLVSEIRSTIALALTDINKHDEAIAICEESIRQNPDFALAHFDLARALLYGKGRVNEAIEAYRESIRLNPDFPFAYFQLADGLSRIGRLNEAADTYRKSLELQPNAVDVYLSLASILCRLGKFNEAEVIARKATEVSPNNPRTYGALATVLQQFGKVDEADAAWHKAVQLKPKTADYNEWAWFLATAHEPKNRNPQRAIEFATKATELAPADGNIWNTLGVAHYQAGKWQDAMKALEKGMELRGGGDASDWFFLATAKWQLGRKDEARTWYGKAIEWMDKNQPKNEELIRFRDEAAELLHLSEPTPASASPNEQPAKADNPITITPPSTDTEPHREPE